MPRLSTPAVLSLSFSLLVGAGACTVDTDREIDPAESTSDGLVTAPAGFSVSSFVTGLAQPTSMEFAPDGRLFVAEQGGKLRVIKNGVLQATPFVTLDVDSSGERGLLGIAFDPAFAQNQLVYVYYTAKTPHVHNRISRFRAQGDVAVAGTETVLLDIDDLSQATNHNGGAIHFGPDGKLYAGVGENAKGSNAQTRSNLLGKMLRLNADGTVPSDNPFMTSATGKNRLIWAMGLRNPFTFAFEPGASRMFINDVGQDTWEEINDGQKGKNYGWPTVEGTGNNPQLTNPILMYGHGQSATTGCSIAGGAFYKAAQFPAAYAGSYFFADACSGWIRVKKSGSSQSTAFVTGASFPVDLKVGADGALYALTRGDGSVLRVRSSLVAGGAPAIVSQPADVMVQDGAAATFKVTATSSSPLSFQWSRGTAVIAGATTATLTVPAVHAADDGASFSARITNSTGSVTTRQAILSVVPAQPREVSFSRDIQPIFDARCTGCHGGSGGLTLTAGSSYANLVGRASSCSPSLKRVTAGNTAQSLLWQKTSGAPTCGGPMPRGTAGLATFAPAEFQRIEAWIREGAKNN